MSYILKNLLCQIPFIVLNKFYYLVHTDLVRKFMSIEGSSFLRNNFAVNQEIYVHYRKKQAEWRPSSLFDTVSRSLPQLLSRSSHPLPTSFPVLGASGFVLHNVYNSVDLSGQGNRLCICRHILFMS